MCFSATRVRGNVLSSIIRLPAQRPLPTASCRSDTTRPSRAPLAPIWVFIYEDPEVIRGRDKESHSTDIEEWPRTPQV